MTRDNTKDRILDAAEQLFSEGEYAATSLRCITTEAQVNLASVNYYFGSKKELYQSVIARRVAPMNSRRLELLDAVEAAAGEGGPGLEDILRAFLEPVFNLHAQVSSDSAGFIKLAVRAHIESDPEIQAVFIEMFRDVFFRFLNAFQQALPDLATEEVLMRVHFLIGAMVHSLHWDRYMSNTFLNTFPVISKDLLLEDLIRFAADGMRSRVDMPGHGRDSVKDGGNE